MRHHTSSENPTALSRRSTLLAGAGLVAAAALRFEGPGGSGGSDGHTKTAPGPLLTPSQLAGQRVIFSYPGYTVPQSLLDQIASGQAAGVIITTGNVQSLSQIAAQISAMRSANRSSPVKAPLLLMTDQEGGEVRRLPGAPTQSEKQIGESSDPAAAASSAGQGAGQLLASVGLNVNLAPVLDVYRTAGDFDDQYQRSYSSDPAVVSTCGSAFITAQQQTGVAATAKHFPGLGPATATQNTDSGPVTLTTSLSDLRGIDEYPYRAAITAGVDLVMVSWAVYTALDPQHPAGLSTTVVQGELRQRLGFTGVTITDAIEAGALRALGSSAQNAVSAAAAGMDLILDASGDVSHGQSVVSGLAAALQGGTLDPTAFNTAVGRVNALRSRLS